MEAFGNLIKAVTFGIGNVANFIRIDILHIY